MSINSPYLLIEFPICEYICSDYRINFVTIDRMPGGDTPFSAISPALTHTHSNARNLNMSNKMSKLRNQTKSFRLRCSTEHSSTLMSCSWSHPFITCGTVWSQWIIARISSRNTNIYLFRKIWSTFVIVCLWASVMPWGRRAQLLLGYCSIFFSFSWMTEEHRINFITLWKSVYLMAGRNERSLN